MGFIFSQFTKENCTEFSEWLKDAYVSRHIFIDNVEKYRLQALKDPHYRMFSVYNSGGLIAHFSAEIRGDDASVCLIVKPELCGKGIGTAVLCEAVENNRKLFGDIGSISAYIYDDNPASRRCFEKAGFVHTERGVGGENKYIYNLKGDQTMNAVIENMLERRSVRDYTTKMPSDDVIKEIIKAGTYAASGMNRQETVILAITNKKVRDELSRDNASFMGSTNDPFYGAPVVLVVLAKESCPTAVYDGSLVMSNLMLAAHSLGVSSCWIHRAKETFEMPKWKEYLKSLGITERYVGIGNCILGYSEADIRAAAPRKENRVYYIK